MAVIPPEQLSSLDLFTRFSHTAWRLESRDRYAVTKEAEPFRKWRMGEIPDDVPSARWLAMIRGLVDQGKRFERVRVVPDPLTDYLRFEAALCYRNIDAGEDIRYLDRDRARELGIPHLNHDYWLFDSHELYQMHFDSDDVLQELELIEDPAKVVQANRYRDAAWHHAIPYRQWYPAHAHDCFRTTSRNSVGG